MKVLLISYHFPPSGVIGGVRPYRLARHLPEFEIEPWVVTVRPEYTERELLSPDGAAPGVPDERITRTVVEPTLRDRVLWLWRGARRTRSPAGGGPKGPGELRRLACVREWALSWLSFPDQKLGWYGPALRAVEGALGRVDFDVVVSTSPPRVAALVAASVSRRRGIPWVMDLRDPWQMHWEWSEVGALGARAALDRLFRKCVRSAHSVVHTTERLREMTCLLVPDAAARTVCIPNGFEPEWVRTDDVRPDTFGLGYYGHIMGGRSAAAFLVGLRRWLDAGRREAGRVRVQFVGSGFEGVRLQAASLGLDKVVSTQPPVPRSGAAQLMCRDFVLLLLANDQPLQVPGKAYDYLATGRRILAVAERDSATFDLLAPLSGCSVANGPDQVAAALDSFYRDFVCAAEVRVDRGAALAEAAYPRRVARYAELLRSIAAG
jgi:hypothetical protein